MKKPREEDLYKELEILKGKNTNNFFKKSNRVGKVHEGREGKYRNESSSKKENLLKFGKIRSKKKI